MSKGLPRPVKLNLDKCRAAAIAAVEVYNRPGARFRTPHFLILAVVSWTAFFHAVFFKRKQKPWYVKVGKGGVGKRYIKIDEEPKHWDLSECLKQYFKGDHSPERKNLEFLIGLRNKIEHRELPSMDASLYGECQSSLLNLEEALNKEFGAKYLLADDLAIALQFSQLIPGEKKKAAGIMAKSESKSVREYVDKFRGGLPSSTLNSTKYSFNVFLVPKLTNQRNSADAAVEFIRVDETNQEEVSRLEKLNVLIKDRQIPIANLGMYRPKDVVKNVANRLKKPFSMAHHTTAWRYYKCRPPSAVKKPEVTDSRFCVFDAVHSDYSYTEDWIQFLVKELSVPAKYQMIVINNGK